MTAALVTGTLYRSPEQRTGKTGRPFVTATIKAKDGESFQWWRVTAFSESAQAELLRLDEGDHVSVQGNFKAELYETRLSLSIIADQVLAVRQPPKERARPKEREAPPDDRRCAGTWPPEGGPSDDIPF
jgi:single-stranded DNA-binding protein